MNTTRHSLRLGAITVLTAIAMMMGVAAHAVVGVTTYVITASGAQQPAKSYTFTGWPSCNASTDPVLSSYIRWYVRDVTATSAFVEKVYIRHTPNRAGQWDSVYLDDTNGNRVIATGLFRNVSSGTATSYTMTVNKRMTLGAVTFRSHWTPKARAGDTYACYSTSVNYNQLRHK